MKHYLCTRWNLMERNLDVYNHSSVSDPKAWMLERHKLFQRYCVPSVMSQAYEDFIWLLSFSIHTPIEDYEQYASLPNVRIIFEPHIDYLNRISGEMHFGELIITSRLDNDDMIGEDYIETVQHAALSGCALIDHRGCQYDTIQQKWFATTRRRPNSPFLSLAEKCGMNSSKRLATCFAFQHTFMPDHFRGQILSKINYCQIIHDHNVANKAGQIEIDAPQCFKYLI